MFRSKGSCSLPFQFLLPYLPEEANADSEICAVPSCNQARGQNLIFQIPRCASMRVTVFQLRSKEPLFQGLGVNANSSIGYAGYMPWLFCMLYG